MSTSITSPQDRCNSGFIFMGNKPLFAKGLDEASTAKRLAGVLSRTCCDHLRFSTRHGWLVRCDDGLWRPNKREALQATREFCHEAAQRTRSAMLTSEAMIAEVMRLAAFEPGMREPIPDNEIIGGRQ